MSTRSALRLALTHEPLPSTGYSVITLIDAWEAPLGDTNAERAALLALASHVAVGIGGGWSLYHGECYAMASAGARPWEVDDWDPVPTGPSVIRLAGLAEDACEACQGPILEPPVVEPVQAQTGRL